MHSAIMQKSYPGILHGKEYILEMCSLSIYIYIHMFSEAYSNIHVVNECLMSNNHRNSVQSNQT
jgi:hypothetical protein